jgi:methylenetetrahydrofolate reductase (NADPH)
MRIGDIIGSSEQPVFSFEFFPPKTDEGEQNLREALSTLTELGPAFASVTYGAGGSSPDRTLSVTKWLKGELGIETMAHVTCLGATATQTRRTLYELAGAGIENVLALRGDVPQAGPTDRLNQESDPGQLTHAAQLVELASAEFGLCCGAACFPEGHPDSPDPLNELHFLKAKVDSGASFLITQMFFDNEFYFRFVEAARFAGIEVPILPGIMPITNANQIKTVTALCGATLPPALLEQIERRADGRAGGAEAVAELGVAYAALQCADLLARGAPGIHFYTLNRSPATRAILSALELQLGNASSSTATTTATSSRPASRFSQPMASVSA